MELVLSTFASFSVNSAEESFYGAFPPEADAPLAQAHGLGNFSCRCSEELKLLKTLDFSQRLMRLWRKSRVEDADRKKFTCERRGL